MLKENNFSLKNIKFREKFHIAFKDEYITSYESTNFVPKIYKSVNTPRDKNGLVSGKTKTYYRTRYSSWATKRHSLNNIRKSEKNSKL